MSHLLLYYQRPEPATWVFLSSFLLLSLYFVFNRFFSVRNLDILLLVLLAPGLMMVYEGRQQKLSVDEVSIPAHLANHDSTSDSAVRPQRLVSTNNNNDEDETSSAGPQDTPIEPAGDLDSAAGRVDIGCDGDHHRAIFAAGFLDRDLEGSPPLE